MRSSGHPRLLKLVLDHQVNGAFVGVEVLGVREL